MYLRYNPSVKFSCDDERSELLMCFRAYRTLQWVTIVSRGTKYTSFTGNKCPLRPYFDICLS